MGCQLWTRAGASPIITKCGNLGIKLIFHTEKTFPICTVCHCIDRAMSTIFIPRSNPIRSRTMAHITNSSRIALKFPNSPREGNERDNSSDGRWISATMSKVTKSINILNKIPLFTNQAALRTLSNNRTNRKAPVAPPLSSSRTKRIVSLLPPQPIFERNFSLVPAVLARTQVL